MTRYYLFDGRPLAPAEFVLTAQARPLRYGDGFFESMRMLGPKVLFAERHVSRMQETLAFLSMIPEDRFHLTMEAEMLWELAGRPAASRVRLQFWHVHGLTYLPESTACHRLMELMPLDDVRFMGTVGVFRMGVFCGQAVNDAPLGNHKTSSCLPSVLGARWARKHGFEDVLMLDCKGHVAEANAANVFFVRDGRLITPDLRNGGLRGVMRSVIIDLASGSGMPVEVREVTVNEADVADEMFITSSVRGIMPATSFNGRVLHRTVTDHLLGLLNKEAFS